MTVLEGGEAARAADGRCRAGVRNPLAAAAARGLHAGSSRRGAARLDQPRPHRRAVAGDARPSIRNRRTATPSPMSRSVSDAATTPASRPRSCSTVEVTPVCGPRLLGDRGKKAPLDVVARRDAVARRDRLFRCGTRGLGGVAGGGRPRRRRRHARPSLQPYRADAGCGRGRHRLRARTDRVGRPGHRGAAPRRAVRVAASVAVRLSPRLPGVLSTSAPT